jgi:homeobox protein cut-like
VATVLEVVRAYQEEIDQLSKRSKFSETAFNVVYKALYDAPDPALLLDGMLEQVTSSSSSQLEIQRLRNELRQYETEFQQLKNQDITIRRLEETIRGFENGNEDRIAEAVAAKAAEAEEHCAAQVRDVKESHRSLEKRLAGVTFCIYSIAITVVIIFISGFGVHETCSGISRPCAKSAIRVVLTG